MRTVIILDPANVDKEVDDLATIARVIASAIPGFRWSVETIED